MADVAAPDAPAARAAALPPMLTLFGASAAAGAVAAPAEPPHLYGLELQENDPRAPQPEKIKTALKPHQSAALARALAMERDGATAIKMPTHPAEYANFSPRELNPSGLPIVFQANVGVLGDIPSYGKTLTALGIVAQNPDTTKIHGSNFTVNRTESSTPMGGYSQIVSWKGAMLGAGGAAAAADAADAAAPDAAHFLPFIRSTLIVVPHGPVYMQWKAAVQARTSLNVLFLDSITALRRYLPLAKYAVSRTGAHERYALMRDMTVAERIAYFADLVAELEKYDAVLFKSTSLKTFTDMCVTPYISMPGVGSSDYCHPFLSWGRVMIDEAHDLLPKLPAMRFMFAWLISATYTEIALYLASRRGTTGFGASLNRVVTPTRIHLMAVKGTESFVVKSFTIPETTDMTYLCRLQATLAAIQEFLTPAVKDRVNAGDIHGAIQMMGGKSETENDLVDLVTRDLVRDIANKRRGEDYLRGLDIPDADRAARLATIAGSIRSLEDRLASIRARLTQLSDKECEICGDPYVNPLFLSCTHVYCAGCMMQWFNSSAGTRMAGGGYAKTCPSCRAPIQGRDLVAIRAPLTPTRAAASGSAGASTSAAAEAEAAAANEPVSKLDTLIRILRANPTGRFLVFSRVDMWNILHRLTEENIPTTELKGTTTQMMNKLASFENNTIRVILLNTRYAGSGIEITCATDVVLFHTMGQDATQAIGRANRVGRTTSLRVHRLLYPHELGADAELVRAPPLPPAVAAPPEPLAPPPEPLAPPPELAALHPGLWVPPAVRQAGAEQARELRAVAEEMLRAPPPAVAPAPRVPVAVRRAAQEQARAAAAPAQPAEPPRVLAERAALRRLAERLNEDTESDTESEE
jgi:hypothetical protein